MHAAKALYNGFIEISNKRREVMNSLFIFTYILMFIGALNWGIFGLTGVDLIALLFGDMSVLSKLVYSFIGLSAIINLSFLAVGNSCEELDCCVSCQ